MAGIYFHIPFCRRRCTYCDFYTQVAPKLKPEFINSAIKELEVRKDYLEDEIIDTVYFGGGTPSILSINDFERIFETINRYHTLSIDAEITFEANPDDLSIDYLKKIRQLPFNRISIGIQSFIDRDLIKINRRHTGIQAIEAVKKAQESGFSNISIDLIYGLPNQSMEEWCSNLTTALQLDVQHISIYGLTFEKGTKLWQERIQGVSMNLDDEIMNKMYLKTLDEMSLHGFEAYEISNFSKPGYSSRHNSSYWKGQKYLGIGPSAHSYDGDSRQWNISNTEKYNHLIKSELPFFEIERLTLQSKYNDYIMVSIRTIEGIDLSKIEFEFGEEYKNYFLKSIQNHINNCLVKVKNNYYSLTTNGILITNTVLIDLMKV